SAPYCLADRNETELGQLPERIAQFVFEDRTQEVDLDERWTIETPLARLEEDIVSTTKVDASTRWDYEERVHGRVNAVFVPRDNHDRPDLMCDTRRSAGCAAFWDRNI